jgi:hypothetical protein
MSLGEGVGRVIAGIEKLGFHGEVTSLSPGDG